ncbi:MAG: Maf family protein [Oscillospiraceae bacterium]|nr:Maf family protein [Oscillospiraceae bacterium]
MQIILASASPRRHELLTAAGFSFTVYAPDIDETIAPGVRPKDAARELACQKAAAVAALYPGACVIAADTIVVVDGEILGKPADEADAARMLRQLSEREHTVITGVCMQKDTRRVAFAEQTQVQFYPLTDDEIARYVATGEPMDKAGAYGIQGRGAVLVKGIVGDFYNVMGLPTSAIRHLQSLQDS